MGVTALVLAAGLSVSVTVATPRSPLPCEEVPIVVTYEARGDLEAVIVPHGGAVFPSAAWLEIDGPGGTVAYRELLRYEETYGTERWPRGTQRSAQVLLSSGQLGSTPGNQTGYAFPVAGSYRFRLHYDDARTGVRAVSQWEQLEVVEPTDAGDILVSEGLRRGVPFNDLRTAHPESRYFAFSRLRDILGRASAIQEGRNPDTGLRADVPRAGLPAWQDARLREVVAALEEEATRSEGAEREALSRARNLASSLGDSARVAALEAKLERKYPNWRMIPDLR